MSHTRASACLWGSVPAWVPGEQTPPGAGQGTLGELGDRWGQACATYNLFPVLLRGSGCGVRASTFWAPRARLRGPRPEVGEAFFTLRVATASHPTTSSSKQGTEYGPAQVQTSPGTPSTPITSSQTQDSGVPASKPSTPIPRPLGQKLGTRRHPAGGTQGRARMHAVGATRRTCRQGEPDRRYRHAPCAQRVTHPAGPLRVPKTRMTGLGGGSAQWSPTVTPRASAHR